MDVASRFGLVSFEEGQFAGKTVRFRLELAQEPTVGRKSGEKDRRPLANVPIVRVWISEVYADGSEARVDENSIDPTSLLCSVDLCAPVSSMNPLSSPSGQNGPSASSQPSSSNPSYASFPMHHQASTPSSSNSSTSYPSHGLPPPAQKRNHARIPAGGRGASSSASSSTGASSSKNGSVVGSLNVSSGGSGSGSGTMGGSSGMGSNGSGGWPAVPGGGEHVAVPSKTKMKTVRNIFGNLIAPAVCLTDLDDEAGLWFIYQDIAIRTEGVYSLRFSLVDLDSRTPDSQAHAPILAECFSNPLTIYAPRNHPGVPPSTKLAKHFVSQGYRLSLKKGGSSSSRNNNRSPPPLPLSSRKRRLSNGSDATELLDGEEDDADDIDGVGEDDEAGGSLMSGSD
ncbi:velvet factor-domain-containing protein [Mrakia frigida]|uniref:velvet factor family protein n=1 Tax=Mrakia frigida TaxID=29902 RepID=UPI003FCC0A50